VERRRFLAAMGFATFAAPAVVRAVSAQAAAQGPDSAEPQPSELSGGGNVGTLGDPTAAGRAQPPTDPRANDIEIQRIEQRLACSCGCTLDVFTCRTTDFTCTYSPALHREVLGLWTGGKRGPEILDAFVAKYGEKALMAPKPHGFNLAGYLVPGVGLMAASAVLLAVLLRRRTAVTAAATGRPPAPSTDAASPEELERLRRALAELDD